MKRGILLALAAGLCLTSARAAPLSFADQYIECVEREAALSAHQHVRDPEVARSPVPDKVLREFANDEVVQACRSQYEALDRDDFGEAMLRAYKATGAVIAKALADTPSRQQPAPGSDDYANGEQLAPGAIIELSPECRALLNENFVGPASCAEAVREANRRYQAKEQSENDELKNSPVVQYCLKAKGFLSLEATLDNEEKSDALSACVLEVRGAGGLAAMARTFEDGVKAYRQQDYPQALRLLRPLAERGDARAQTIIGSAYAEGHGVTQDQAEAAKWFSKAAERGVAVAQLNLGLMYASGQGVAQDYAEAAKWLRKAAEQGDAKAQAYLGFMYDNGQGVPKDWDQAMEWYQMAAKQGYAAAQSNIGTLYIDGRGVPKDYAEAMKWYRKAADQAYAPAEFSLGYMFHMGYGVQHDNVEAMKWYRALSRALNLLNTPSALCTKPARVSRGTMCWHTCG